MFLKDGIICCYLYCVILRTFSIFSESECYHQEQKKLSLKIQLPKSFLLISILLSEQMSTLRGNLKILSHTDCSEYDFLKEPGKLSHTFILLWKSFKNFLLFVTTNFVLYTFDCYKWRQIFQISDTYTIKLASMKKGQNVVIALWKVSHFYKYHTVLPLSWYWQNIPLHTLIKLCQIYTKINYCQVLYFILVP